VVKTFQREVNVVYTIVYSNGTQVETTDEHPFYIEGKGWVPAKDLRSGDRSVLSNEKTLEIESIRISERTTTVYNFEVEGAHSYYVSEVGILVHNDCVVTGPSMSLAAFNALLKYMPGASEAEIEAARKLIEIGNRPVDGTMDAVFDVAAYIDAACKNGCPPDIAMAPIKLGVSGLKVASELIRSGRFKEALSLFGSGVKNWVRGGSEVGSVLTKGHTLPWLEMSKAEQNALKHSYARHSAELGLPNWQETKAESLRLLFNDKVTSIRTAGANSFFQSTEWVNGVRTTVNRTEPIIGGQKYYYYETLDGKFVSAGKF
ncbi:Hint domain-containing protein, partial [Leptospira alexanderi]|uniref:Hint domain-containing protein n=1 Tax=Leptospira alexanderi TaxID=100053 RepID=UPI002014C9DE